jgi:apolipoprotein N-acyltransferase
LMRAANTGITTGFNARGHELGRLSMGVRGTLELPLGGAEPPTIFARGGLTIPALLALLALIAGFADRKRHFRSGLDVN